MKMRRFWVVALPVLALLSIVAAGCSGGGGQEGEIDLADRALLERMVLTAEDLDNGMQQVSAALSTNKDVAGSLPESEEQLEQLEQWGRKLGYDVEFQPTEASPPDLPVQGMQNTASLYETAGGAADSMAEGVVKARQTDWDALYPGLSEFNVDERSFDLGDETLWFRISGIEQPGGRLILDDQVVVRVGRVRSFLRVVSVHPPGSDREIYADQVGAWAQVLVQRIQDALPGTSPGP